MWYDVGLWSNGAPGKPRKSIEIGLRGLERVVWGCLLIMSGKSEICEKIVWILTIRVFLSLFSRIFLDNQRSISYLTAV